MPPDGIEPPSPRDRGALIKLQKHKLVAEDGFEPSSAGYEPAKETRLLYPAINLFQQITIHPRLFVEIESSPIFSYPATNGDDSYWRKTEVSIPTPVKVPPVFKTETRAI